MPNVQQIGWDFLRYASEIISTNMPKIEKVDNEYIQKLLNSKQKIKKMQMIKQINLGNNTVVKGE